MKYDLCQTVGIWLKDERKVQTYKIEGFEPTLRANVLPSAAPSTIGPSHNLITFLHVYHALFTLA